jgi:hypothetical protein
VSKEQDQDNARRVRAREVGLFRYGLIQDALEPALSTKQRGRLVRAIAAQTHPGPFGTPVQVSRSSLDRWIRNYRPPASVRVERLMPSFPLSVGLRPATSPPHGAVVEHPSTARSCSSRPISLS